MNRIKVLDIDFSSLKKMTHQGSRSTIYEDDNICYKMLNLDCFFPQELNILERKLMNMDGIKIENAYLPIDLIFNGEKLAGFTLNKFNNSIPIYDKFSNEIDFKELFKYISKACIILREIHKNKIICQDLSFDNILVDNNGIVAFCDLDGCCYNGYDAPFISMPMKKLICEYRNENFITCENFDRISMLVSLYYLIYNKYLYKVSRSSYNSLSKNVETINRAMVYVNSLLDKSKSIPEFPYLDELIVPTDDYVMNKAQKLNLFRRILKK